MQQQSIWQTAALIRQTVQSSLEKDIQVFFKRNRLRRLPYAAKHLSVWWFYRPLFASKNHLRYNLAVILKLGTQIMMLKHIHTIWLQHKVKQREAFSQHTVHSWEYSLYCWTAKRFTSESACVNGGFMLLWHEAWVSGWAACLLAQNLQNPYDNLAF